MSQMPPGYDPRNPNPYDPRRTGGHDPRMPQGYDPRMAQGVDPRMVPEGQNPEDPRNPQPKESSSAPLWMWGVVLIILVTFAVVYSSGPMPAFGGWTRNYEGGLEQAQESDKLVLLAFTSRGCGACRYMEREVLSKETVRSALSNWVAVKLNPRSNSKLSTKYRVEAIPTYVILSPDGRRIDQFVGAMEEASFLGWLDRAKRRYNESRPDAAPSE